MPGDRGRVPSGTDQRSQFPQMDQMDRPVFLSGKVVLDDGTPPPEPVIIERVCNGVPRPEGYTDSKGRFSFQLGQNSLVMADASVGWGGDMDTLAGPRRSSGGFNPSGNTIRERDLNGCELRASFPGYQSDEASLAGRKYMDNPDVGVIVLHRRGNVEGTTVSMVSLQAPKEAKQAFEKGRAALKKENWQEARKQYEKAVGLYPQYATAWTGLGVALERLNDTAGARNAYTQASTSDPKYVYPHVQLAGLAAKAGNWQELLDTTNHALKLDPLNYPVVYLYNSVAQLNLRNVDDAEKSAREGLKLDTQHRFPKINQLLGVIMARKGDFPAATGYMKSYLQLAPQASDAELVKKQLVEVEKLAQNSPVVAP